MTTRYRTVVSALAVLLLCPPRIAFGQVPPAPETQPTAPAPPDASGGELWRLADHLYYEPLLAEQRAARMFLLFPGWSKEFPHSQESGSRFAWQVTMGREIPIVGWQTERVGTNRRLSPGEWGIGLWIPISFHVVEDFTDESNPIVDTDYRFGAMVKLQRGLTNRSWLSVRFVPIAHESTHLGDEYTILAQARPDFERVNVSYEYGEFGVSYDRTFARRSALTARTGGIWLWGGDGYYSDHLLGQPAATLSPTRKNYEQSVGVEYRFANASARTRQFIASLDLRYRLQYSFHHPVSGPERRRPTWTIAIGRTTVVGDPQFLRSYFGYFTYGVNPFGQLRAQYPYWAAGIGWVFQ